MPRSASWSSISRITRSSSTTATASPTSRSMPTPTSRGEGGFNLDNYPHVNAWLARVAAQPGHVTIDHKN